MNSPLLGTTAPDLQTTLWFNTDQPVTLAGLRGKVVVIEAFQMLCPGCVSHGLPQAQMIHKVFPKDQVAVVGLHTVFEHHEAMAPVSLKAFIHEYGLTFPIGVDLAGSAAIPQTMEAYGMRGTPSLVLINGDGIVRAHHFGRLPDIQVAYEISRLVSSGADSALVTNPAEPAARCNDNGCPADTS
jgi:peroxiredoxin